MHPYLNVYTALLLNEERLREAERHRRNYGDHGTAARQPRWWRRRRDDRGPRRGDHTLAA
jgi:hypothetical protein